MEIPNFAVILNQGTNDKREMINSAYYVPMVVTAVFAIRYYIVSRAGTICMQRKYHLMC